VIDPLPALGARPLPGGGCRFDVWAPAARGVAVELLEPAGGADLEPSGDGSFGAVLDGVEPGRRYRYRLDGGEPLPDPASALQPDGVHGPSAVVDPAFPWTDAGWRGLPLHRFVLYELHVGTFTAEGTFDAIVPRLGELAELGVTAIELMPVSQFSGARNWGYDGVFPYAVQDTYGGPDGLKRLVDAAHAAGLAVCLDVVLNHLGPEGNVLPRYGPYLTDRYRTPWGPAVNVDGPGSDGVRAFLAGAVLRWFCEFHLDALRLDAADQIPDRSALHFLAELAIRTEGLAERLGRPLHLIAESDLNDPRMVTPTAAGGLGMDAQWADDLHHALHALLTGDRHGYYADFGGTAPVAKAFREPFVLDGVRSAHRGRRHGGSARGVPARRFVVCSQNHDQVGNRARGDRLGAQAGVERAKLAAGAVLVSPYLPLLFMGEEHAETAPFPYFTSHEDTELAEAVRRGRSEEFAAFRWQGEPPDPQAEETFTSARLHWDARRDAPHAGVLAWYRELLRRRRELAALDRGDPGAIETARSDDPPVVWVRRTAGTQEAIACLYFGESDCELETPFAAPGLRVGLDSADARFAGPGAGALDGRRLHARATSFVLLEGGDGA
jgi:maltooligosyltrehalose trehalohydrolase